MKIGLQAIILIAIFSAVAISQPKPKTDPNKLTVAEAERRLNPHIAYIEDRMTAMAAAYYYVGAKETLENAFRKAGVRSMGYAGSWGTNGMGLTWSQTVKAWYAYHRDRLTRSLEIIREQGYATPSDLEYLDRGMQAWKQSERLFPDQFEILVDLYTREALAIDEKNAIGERYQPQFDRVSNARPYRSDQIEALKAARDREIQPLNVRLQLLDAALETTAKTMAQHADEHIFEAIDQKPKTGIASGAAENERP